MVVQKINHQGTKPGNDLSGIINRMPIELTRVSTCEITPAEDFRISFNPNRPPLRGVEEFGILQPPILLRAEAGLLIVCGFRRVEAARSHGLESVPAMVCAGLDRRQTVLLGLLERLSQGELNDVERARAVEKFRKNGWLPGELSEALFPLLGMKMNSMALEQLQTLLQMPREVQAKVAAREMHLYTAHRLSFWGGRVEQIAQWFSTLGLGVNKQRELLDLMDEVVRVNKLPPDELIGILDQIRCGEPVFRVYDAWIRELKSRRYPRLTEAERQFEESKARFKLPGQIQLMPSPYFEENRYRIAFPFQSREELERYSRKLLEMAASSELDAILKLI